MLADSGYSIILITHKMSEVMTYADRVTVMRLGEVIGSVNVKDTTEQDLAHMMVGRDVHLERQITRRSPDGLCWRSRSSASIATRPSPQWTVSPSRSMPVRSSASPA